VTFWCPSDVLEALEKVITPRKPGAGKSATIVAALRQYLGQSERGDDDNSKQGMDDACQRGPSE